MKKALSLFLAAAMLVLVLLLAACGGQPETTTTITTSTNSTETTSSFDGTTASKEDTGTSGGTTATSTSASGTTASGGSAELTGKEKHPDFMDVNFGGKTFNFVTQKGWSGGWDTYEICAEATGQDDLITEAVISRNSVVEDLYNCKISETKSDDPLNLVNNDIALGTNNYDFVMRLVYIVPSSCMNIANLDIDLSHSWWNQDYIDAFSFDYNGKKVLHSISGKFNLIMYDSINTLFVDMDVYDRAIASGKTNIDLYQTVKDGKWTVEKMLELMDAAKVDVNGDSQLNFDDGDIFGFLAHKNSHSESAFFYSTGIKTVMKDDNNQYVSINASNTDMAYVSKVIDEAAKVYQSPGFGSIGELNSVKALANGQSLFSAQWMIRLHSNHEFVNYGIDFSEKRISVVPYPKFDENQEDYHSYIFSRGYGLQVSKAITDHAAAAQFLEVFGYHSEKLLYPEYIKCIKTQCLCDEGAGEMLEIVLQSAFVDYGHYNPDVGIMGRISSMISSGKNNISKAISSASQAADGVLATYMQDSYDRMN